MLINYRAPGLVAGRRPYPSYEAAMVLKSLGQVDVGETPEIPAEVFAGKIVFVGLNALTALVFIEAAPAWGIILITVDVVVIYAITVHGSELRDL